MSIPTGAMGLMGLFGSAASSAANTYASYQEAKTQQLVNQYNASQLENDAVLADMRADQAVKQGEFNASIAGVEGRNKIERQRAGYAASGVRVDSGSALDTVAEQAGWNQLEQDVLRHNANMEAWGIKSEAANLRRQAQFTRMGGLNPKIAGATTLLSTGTSLFNQYQQYQMFDKQNSWMGTKSR